MSTEALRWRIGLIGYGEVGRILAEDLRARDLAVSVYDVKLAQPDAAAASRTAPPSTACGSPNRMPTRRRAPTC